jgi:dolichol-phosphate mannosyltransferase
MHHLVICPTYNEVKNIAPLVEKIFENTAQRVHILFVDDHSEDGTHEEILKAQEKYKGKIHLIRRSGKLGLGTAYVAGFKWALASGSYDYIVQIDGDLSHDPMYLKPMFQALESQDFVIGSRNVKGGGTKNWSFIRRIISKFGSFYSRVILGVPIYDFTGGFNGWRSHTLEKLDLDSIRSNGYSFQIELKYRAYKLGFKFKEIPILFIDRLAGSSKMSYKIILEAIRKVWGFRFSPRSWDDL